MADAPVLQVQLDVINQEIEYNGTPKTIPETYWKDTLTPLLYPLWDSDKDKLITFQYFTNDSYTAKRRKYVKDFKTNTFKWVDYEMEAVGAAEATAFKDKLIEGFYLIDSLENQDFQDELARMYSKQKAVSPFSIRLARNFLLDETDWTQLPDAPIDADLKAQYTLYRTKLRELTDSTEFTNDTENTKFPISPEFYNKVYKVDFPTEDYLATADQFIEMGKHRLKKFRDKIAYFLTLKSETDKTYFNDMLVEYDKIKTDRIETPREDLDTEKNRTFLERIIKDASDELGNMS
ncbi:MAG: hypothetical protein CMB76_07395 [Euryarchaeota archaeon]|nr:hypothetical protein [Euryarchaeota archaeon]|tara:strand:+ start:7164 stop:8039 length:876 start_codon:yes stop_codon:yes gene_type:complete